jgi:hypothetical protein
MAERAQQTASRRTTIVRVLLVLYALGSVAVAVPLVLDLTGAGELVGTTSGKILAAAVFSLGLGAAMAARDPWRNRVMIRVLIMFTALAAIAILSRLLFHDKPYRIDPAWILLPFAIAAPVLLGVFYPRAPGE